MSIFTPGPKRAGREEHCRLAPKFDKGMVHIVPILIFLLKKCTSKVKLFHFWNNNELLRYQMNPSHLLMIQILCKYIDF